MREPMDRPEASEQEPQQPAGHAELDFGRKQPRDARRFRQRTCSLGGACPGVDLTKALQLAETLEDDARTAR